MFERFDESNENENGEKKLGGGELAAAILVPVVFCLLLGALIYFYLQYKSLNDLRTKFETVHSSPGGMGVLDLTAFNEFIIKHKDDFCLNCQSNFSELYNILNTSKKLTISTKSK
jgi:hypothetical protein